MSTIKSSAENLTLNADGANNDIKFQSNGSEVASIDQAGVMTATSFAGSGANLTGLSSFNPDAAVTINESGADVDFRVESDNDANALFVQGSDGNVGIGISTPTNPLTVEGDGARIAFSNTATYPCLAGISAFRSGTSHGNMYIETAGGSNFNTPAERIAIEGTTGEVKISTGDLIFGTAGKGIVLGNTSNVDANTLNDYEEGTFTPVFKDTSNATVNGSLYNASYTKIGQMVFISLYYSPSDVQNGYLMNMSLPFTSSSANHRSAGSLWTYNGPIPEKSNQWLVQTNTAHASFWKLRDNQISPTMQWDNGTEIVLSIAYFTSQ